MISAGPVGFFESRRAWCPLWRSAISRQVPLVPLWLLLRHCARASCPRRGLEPRWQHLGVLAPPARLAVLTGEVDQGFYFVGHHFQHTEQRAHVGGFDRFPSSCHTAGDPELGPLRSTACRSRATMLCGVG